MKILNTKIISKRYNTHSKQVFYIYQQKHYSTRVNLSQVGYKTWTGLLGLQGEEVISSVMDCVFVVIMSIAIVLDGVKAIKNGSVKKDFRFLNFYLFPRLRLGLYQDFYSARL